MKPHRVWICGAPAGGPCGTRNEGDKEDCLACQIRDFKFEEKLRDLDAGRMARVCKEILPGPCDLAKLLGGECLVCLLQDRGGSLAILQDEYKTLEMKLERLKTFEKSEVERQRLEVEVEEWTKRIAAMVKAYGRESDCWGDVCEATIYYIRSKKGKGVPYDLDGRLHIVTCPDAKLFPEKST